MPMLREREREREAIKGIAERATYALEALFVTIGVVAGAIGAYLYYASETATVDIFGWEWTVGDVAVAWPFSLLIAAGALLFAAFGMIGWKVYRRDRAFTMSATVSVLLSLAALAGAVTYLLIWIL